METKKELSVVDQLETVKNVISEANGIIKLESIEATSVFLTDLREKYKDFKVSEDNYEEAKKVRMELRQPRYDLQNIEKNNIRVIEEEKKAMKSAYAELIDINKDVEARIDSEIKAVEEEKKRRAEEKRLAEQKRINEIKDNIQEWTTTLATVYENCVSLRSEKNLVDKIEELKQENFAEYQFKVDDLIEKYQEKLPGLKERIQKIIDKEAENKRLAEENERLRVEKIKDDIENYTALMTTLSALGGDISNLERTTENPPTKEDFYNINRLIVDATKPAPDPEKEKTEKKVEEVLDEPKKAVEEIKPEKSDQENKLDDYKKKRDEIIAEEEKAKIPEQLLDGDIEIMDLRVICSDYIDFLNNDDEYSEDNDYSHYIFEKAMETLYGKEVWVWINNRRK